MKLYLVLLIASFSYGNEMFKNQSFSQNFVVTTYGPRDEILKVLECIRRVIRTGIPSRDIPPLDPYQQEIIPLNFSFDKIVDSKMLLKNFLFEGLSEFNTTEVKFNTNVIKSTVKIVLDFPPIHVFSHYNGSMKLLDLFDLFGTGSLDVSFANFSVDVSITIKTPIFGKLAITKLALDVVLPFTTVKLTGFQNDNAMSSIVSEQLTDILTSLAQESNEDFNTFLYDVLWHYVTTQINPSIGKLSLADLIKIIAKGSDRCKKPIWVMLNEVIPALLNGLMNIQMDKVLKEIPNEYYRYNVY